ncbi:unnamed protein product [Alopecurus aequalis]
MGWSNGWKFDVTIASHRQSFTQFMEYVRSSLGVGGVVMQDARRLPPRQDNPQFQDLELSANGSTILLRLRTDNLYVVGFRNAAGLWFHFMGDRPIQAGTIESTEMTITGSYVGAHGLGGLDGINLSSHAVENAVSGLASYAVSGNNEQLRTWLRMLIVSFVESSRFTTVADTVAAAMGGAEQVLSSRLIGQIRNWGSLSTVVILAANTRYTDPTRNLFTQFEHVPDWDIHGAISAAAALGLVLTPMRTGAGPSRPLLAIDNDSAYGITLLEVLSVVILDIDGENPGGLYGTVRVHDSFGSVDLFNRGKSNSQSVRPGERAELLWPARAISADDDLIIDLNLMDHDNLSPDDEVSRGEVVWVPRDVVSSDFDVVRKAVVKGKYGSAEVSYAVVRNAVVATMEVLLVDGDGESKPGVYGTITATTLMMGTEKNSLDYVLFRRARSNEIDVPKNTNIPLLRRVITAVWGSPLTVNVELWDKDSDLSPDDQIAAGSVSFDPLFEYSQAKQVTGRYGKVEVRVSWWLSHEEMK